jgi:hypothetical protein
MKEQRLNRFSRTGDTPFSTLTKIRLHIDVHPDALIAGATAETERNTAEFGPPKSKVFLQMGQQK